MVSISLQDKKFLDQKSKSFILFLHQDFSFDSVLKQISTASGDYLQDFFKEKKFTGKWQQIVTLPVHNKGSFTYYIFVGLGNPKTEILEYYRRSVAQALRTAQSLKVDSCALLLPNIDSVDYELIIKTTTVIVSMTLYAFDDFLSNAHEKVKIKDVVMVSSKKVTAEDKKALADALIIGDAVNRTRHLVDLPANFINPTTLSEKAAEYAKEYGVDITIFKQPEIIKMGMGGLNAVGMGSQHGPRLVVMEYKVKSKKAPTIAIVGKGITFDSGGYNIKPTGYIEDMKDDMSGAAAVINTICAIAQLKAHVNVVAVAPLAENMVSGGANHPGDIIRFYNGKTALVGNTDAEGRLVLADGLSYVEKNYNPDVIIDLATLTGAAAHAVGPFFSCLLTQDEKLADTLLALGQTSGDALWRLPLINLYKKMVETAFADMCNDGKTKYKAGPTNGACFLSNFVEKTPWAHIDIAPTAFDVPDTPYYQTGGAAGAGVRLLIDFIMNYA